MLDPFKTTVFINFDNIHTNVLLFIRHYNRLHINDRIVNSLLILSMDSSRKSYVLFISADITVSRKSGV